MKRNPLKLLLGQSIRMPDQAWRVLTVRYLIFFAASAMVNEIVWRTQSDASWLIFKLIYIVVVLGFSIAQAPFLMKHMEAPGETPPTAEPPDAGF
jgi:intracellular septation protein